jgi:hypothetical protein
VIPGSPAAYNHHIGVGARCGVAAVLRRSRSLAPPCSLSHGVMEWHRTASK